MCVQGAPPQHHRFNDSRIPAHITYAYQEDVEIVENDAFYALPTTGRHPKTIDMLFLIANAPVQTASLPVAGSESYVGTALTMKLAMDKLYEKFY